MLRPLITTALLALTAMPAAAQKTTLKFAIFVPEKERTIDGIMRPFAKSVMADSKGTLEIKLFPNGALGRHPAHQIKMIQDGVADIAFVIPAYTPGQFPDNSLFELPDIIRNSTEGSIAAWRLQHEGQLRGYENFAVIGLFTSSPYTVHMKNKITSMSQISGKKIRAVGPAMVASMKALGAAPEAMPFPKVVEALSRGVIDGTTAFPSVLYDFGVYRIARHHYLGRLGALNVSILMNKRKLASLPAVARAAIEKHRGEPLSRAFGAMTDARTKRLLATWAKDPKHTVVRLSPAEEAKWQATLKPVVDNWVKVHPNGEKLLADLKKELAAIRSEK